MTAFRSGFASVVGRTNVGKSTLVNAMVGSKVTIISPRPNTTRSTFRGVLNRPDAQVVLVDTPGLHKPKTALGSRMNEAAATSLEDIDVVICVLDATAAVGPGDRMVLERAAAVRSSSEEMAAHDVETEAGGRVGEGGGGGPALMVVVNKVDRVGRGEVVARLAAAAVEAEAITGDADSPRIEYFPVSARTGEGVAALVDAVVGVLPEGPPYYPEGMVHDVPEAAWVADLVREQLLSHVADELPHSIACRVSEWEWPRIRCEIIVERDSQKGIVIGKGGALLKTVGTAVRSQLPEGAYLELFVRVEKRWQQREDALDRLGL